ncbi:MAG TPA: NfeD family protein [Gaiellaceae bacterium]|nr:NfeD family protein [Gaiellaceae bacterium]
MTALGVALLVVGGALLVAEAHVPGGVFAAFGGVALVAGGVVVITVLGAGAAVAVPVGVGIGVAAGAWALVASGKARSARRARVQAGSEALCGRTAVVRRWGEPDGQVFIDGALWRARRRWAESDGEPLQEGDLVVVERVNGLTLSVRRAEEWELIE